MSGESTSARIAAVDLNGLLRGKRVPRGKLGQPMRMPYSALNVDIFGFDIDDSPLVFASGDADGTLLPAPRDPVPLPWLAHRPPLQLSSMHHEDGRPFEGDPRRALDRILARYADRGWGAHCAVELEFYLVELDGALAAPVNPRSGRRLLSPQVLGLRQLDGFEAFFNDVEAGAADMGLAALTITSESGLGQFEVTLDHGPAMTAAEDAILLKELIKGTARNHGLSATFLAKPFSEDAGNGLHLHASVLDASGANVFDDGGPDGMPTLRHAIAGTLAALRASTVLFAPHLPSYARFVDNAHAPTTASWGYDNRTVAVRVPSGPPAARRLEHRVAGGDVNPYLLFAAILGAAITGIEDAAEPPAPAKGNAYAQSDRGLAPDLPAAIEALSEPVMARIFHPALLDGLTRTKRQDFARCAQLSESDLVQALLETV
ncbi:MAG: glutamine synthetase family protein [Pseudomonadota bacterium]